MLRSHVSECFLHFDKFSGSTKIACYYSMCVNVQQFNQSTAQAKGHYFLAQIGQLFRVRGGGSHTMLVLGLYSHS